MLNRREFLKSSTAVASTLVIPPILAVPAQGRGWQEYAAVELLEGDVFYNVDLAYHSVCMALKRSFVAGGFKEISGLKIEKTFDLDTLSTAVMAVASFR